MSRDDQMRIKHIVRRLIAERELDLAGLTVFTEAATGAYLYTPVLAALAGADQVYAVTADSRFGSKEEVREETLRTAAAWGAEGIKVLFEKRPAEVSRSDIFTNSGFVRPIDREMISWMKPTAVVPLMFEPWEHREGDVDLTACREHDILVLGTNEDWLYPLGVFYALKLLFELSLEGFGTRVLLLGGGQGLGESIAAGFGHLGIEHAWFCDTSTEARPYAELPAYFEVHGQEFDAIILAEHEDSRLLIGSGGTLEFETVRSINPAIRIGVISGNLNREELERSGLRSAPEHIRSFGYMSFQAYDLGPKPVLELYSAGLKVGQEMARARRRGLTPRAAAMHALEKSPGLDFEGRHSWTSQ